MDQRGTARGPEELRGSIIMTVSKPAPPDAQTDDSSEEYERFDRMTRALFRVDKRDVPKHVPERRENTRKRTS